MTENWVKLLVGTNPIEMELTKQMLEEHDVPAVLMNKQDSSYRFGQLELYVHESEEATARFLLALQQEHPDDSSAPDSQPDPTK